MKSLYNETLPGGWAWSHILKKGTALEITDPTGTGCGALSFFNPKDLSERYNMPDTLKGQYTAILTRGHGLYSDMGRIHLSIIEDTFGGHDPIAGLLTQEDLEKRFGVRTYQEFRNDWHQSGLGHLWTELGKYSLDIHDLSSVVNLFAALKVEPTGALVWDGDKKQPGQKILLQAEMDTLVVLAATQHPFDPRTVWQPGSLELTIYPSQVPLDQNPVWKYSEQNQRGLSNTFLYNL